MILIIKYPGNYHDAECPDGFTVYQALEIFVLLAYAFPQSEHYYG